MQKSLYIPSVLSTVSIKALKAEVTQLPPLSQVTTLKVGNFCQQ